MNSDKEKHKYYGEITKCCYEECKHFNPDCFGYCLANPKFEEGKFAYNACMYFEKKEDK